ncbi:MAG: hypothetical protein AAFX50_25335 [Acidobacteriota bacterium]
MIFRRRNLIAQLTGWTGVALEFLLVLFGVLIALQVNNWNTSRIDRDRAGKTLSLLRSEVEANIAAIDDRLALLGESQDVRQSGLAALSACDPSPAARKAVGDAVGQMTGVLIPNLVDISLLELARQGRFLDLLSNDFRAALNVYSGRLSGEREQLTINYNLMWAQHVVHHSAIGIEMEDADIRDGIFVLDRPVEELCQDSEFHRQFSMTEGWHQSAMLRMERFRGWSEDFLAMIDKELASFR